MAELVASLVDISGEVGTVTMKIADQAGATTISAVETLATTLETALEGISHLTLKNIWFRQGMLTEDGAAPSSPYANRENGALVFFHNNVSNEKGRVTVPGPDLVNVARNTGTDEFDLSDTEMAALVTWMETNIAFRGEVITVDKALYVGRNN